MSEANNNILEQWEHMNPAEILRDIRKLGNSSRTDAVEYRKMAGKAYLASIERLIQALQEMVDEEISTADLIIEVYGESDSIEYMGEMFQVDADVHKAAERAGCAGQVPAHLHPSVPALYGDRRRRHPGLPHL